MIIKVERSGGLVAIPICVEMDVKDLPLPLISTIKKVMMDQKLYNLSSKETPKGAADYYSYKISIHDGINKRVVECNEYNIKDDLKLLVKYIERTTKKGEIK